MGEKHRIVVARVLSVIFLTLIWSCSPPILVSDPAIVHVEVPDAELVKQSGYRKQVRSSWEVVRAGVPKTLASSYMLLGRGPDNTILVSALGTIVCQGKTLFAEFPMTVVMTPNDDKTVEIYVLPSKPEAVGVKHKCEQSYKVRQEYYARKLMYRIAVEFEGRYRWPWIYEIEAQDTLSAR